MKPITVNKFQLSLKTVETLQQITIDQNTVAKNIKSGIYQACVEAKSFQATVKELKEEVRKYITSISSAEIELVYKQVKLGTSFNEIDEMVAKVKKSASENTKKSAEARKTKAKMQEARKEAFLINICAVQAEIAGMLKMKTKVEIVKALEKFNAMLIDDIAYANSLPSGEPETAK